MKTLVGTLAEQFAYTGGFFITQVIAARVLGLNDFALFSALYSSVILLSIIHSCTTADILLMFGKCGQALDRSSLTRILLPVMLLVILSAGYFAFSIGDVKTGVLIPLFFIAFVMYWTLRSIAILDRQTFKLLIPPVLQVAVLSVLLLYPSAASLDLIMVLITVCLGIPTLFFWRIMARRERYTIETRDWIGFSVSNTAAQVVLWGMTHGMVIFLLAQGDHAGSAFFRVVMTLILPVQYFGIALSNHYLPRLVKLRRESHSAYYKQCALLFFVGVGSSALYAELLYVGGDRLPHMIFGDQFKGIGLSQFAIMPISLAIIQSGRTVLKSSQRNGYVLISMLIGLATFVAHCIHQHGALSAEAMLVGVNVTAGCVMLSVVLSAFLIRFKSAEVSA